MYYHYTHPPTTTINSVMPFWKALMTPDLDSNPDSKNLQFFLQQNFSNLHWLSTLVFAWQGRLPSSSSINLWKQCWERGWGVMLPRIKCTYFIMLNWQIRRLKHGREGGTKGQFPFICFLANLWTADKQSQEERPSYRSHAGDQIKSKW